MFEIFTTNKTPTLWMLIKFVIGCAIAIGVVVIPIAGFNGMFVRNVTPIVDTYSVKNVKALSTTANEMHSGLEGELATLIAQKTSINTYEDLYGEDKTKWPQGKRDEYQQEQVLYRQGVSAYNTNCGKYNALWNNEWKSVVAPDDLPEQCELLTSVP